MELNMYTDMIGIKSRLYSEYRVDFGMSTSRTWFERVVLYVLAHTGVGTVVFRDQSEYIVTWFDIRRDIWG